MKMCNFVSTKEADYQSAIQQSATLRYRRGIESKTLSADKSACAERLQMLGARRTDKVNDKVGD